MENAASTAQSLQALIRRETAVIEAGHGYGELRTLSTEKQTLSAVFREQIAELQTVGWETVLELPGAADFAEHVTRLSEAIQENMRGLQRAILATERVARIVARVQHGVPLRGYGSEGRSGAAKGRRATALNDSI
jgi:FlgN protein.